MDIKSKLEDVKRIVSITNQIECIDDKIDFSTKYYQDEFHLAYSQEDTFSRHTSKIELLPRDVEVLKEYWNLQKIRLEDELAELLK